MSTSVLKTLSFIVVLASCSPALRNNKQNVDDYSTDYTDTLQPLIGVDQKPLSLTDLPQTQYGGFVLKPGFYEAEFKTYCLQPGTPDPAPRDAYLQSPMTGFRKDMVESVLYNSRKTTDVSQRNVQLLLWSIVSNSDFNKLSPTVRADAMKLLTAKQIFELKGGVMGAIKTVSYSSGIFKANSDMQRMFEIGTSSYESFERLAVLKEPSQIRKTGVKYDQWYKQKENYYVRYFPASYQRVKIQVYVPVGLTDTEGKIGDEYLVFKPTGQQAIPAYTNAQRLGIGGPVTEIVKVVIQVSKEVGSSKKKTPAPKKETTRPGKFPNQS